MVFHEYCQCQYGGWWDLLPVFSHMTLVRLSIPHVHQYEREMELNVNPCPLASWVRLLAESGNALSTDKSQAQNICPCEFNSEIQWLFGSETSDAATATDCQSPAIEYERVVGLNAPDGFPQQNAWRVLLGAPWRVQVQPPDILNCWPLTTAQLKWKKKRKKKR